MVELELNGVTQTLLLPLMGRAKLSQENNSIFNDAYAIRLTQNLAYDFDSLIRNYGTFNLLWWLARAYQFDKIIKEYLLKFPRVTVVNLGAGLETAFYRIDNGALTWVDIDLPEVIKLKEQLLPCPERVHYIATSILEDGWIEKIKALNNNFIFLAAGVFMYFTEGQLEIFFKNLSQNFPASTILFDFLSKDGLKYANIGLEKSKLSNVKINWGIDNVNEVLRWLPIGAKVFKKPYFKGIKTKLNLSVLTKMKLLFYDTFDKGGLAIVKLKGN